MSNRAASRKPSVADTSSQGSLAFDACGPSVDCAAEARRRESALPRHEARKAKRVLSYGGGLDSFGMLVDSVNRDDKPDLVVFADVTDPERKDPGEWDETYSHIERVAIPYCKAHGIEFVWLDTVTSPIRGHRSLYAYLKSLRAMVGRMSRMCTVAAKVERVAAFVESRFPEGPIEMWIGFEAGEQGRAEKDPHSVGAKARRSKKARKVQRRTSRFPLIERGLCRCRLVQLIRAAGLEVPPGSACMFCPFSNKGDFKRLQGRPERFVSVVDLERSAKETKKGAVIRFAGGANDPTLDRWVEQPYRQRKMACEVCGAENKVRKNVGCSPAEMEALV